MYFNYKIGVVFMTLFMFSCANDDDSATVSAPDVTNQINIYPAPPSQWMGENGSYYTSGYVADIMPYFDNGKFNLFFLHDAKTKPAGEGFHDIHRFETSNLTDFTYNGRMIPYGLQDEPDFAIGTGSIVKKDDLYYFYYTGHNGIPSFLQSNARESVLCATSTDLKNWTKIEDFKITAPSGYYDFDFRDPHVFFNEEAGEYWMLMSTQTNSAREAVVLLFTTDDLASNNWTVQDPIYKTPSEEDYLMLECADMFQMGNYWYLVFSENWSDHVGTHYRMATSSSGPWTKPENDRFDGEYFYAAKTETNGADRFIFGWNARKSPENNLGNKEYAGNLVAHKLVQNHDGTLSVKQPEAIENVFSKEVDLEVERISGDVDHDGTTVVLNSGAQTSSIVFKPLKPSNQIKFNLKLPSNGGTAGLIVAQDLETGSGFKIAFEPAHNRIVAYLKNASGDSYVNHISFSFSGDATHNVTLTVNNDVCVLYINDQIAFSNRVYDINTNWSIYGDNTHATFSNIAIKTPY